MSDKQECPNEARWQELLDGSVPEDRQSELASHLESCTDCRQTLERLSGGSNLPSGSGGPAPNDAAAGDAIPQDLLQKLKQEPVEATSPSERPALTEMSLSFLDRSDNPQHLGRLGPYEITGVIGHGGMGVVLKGLDPRLNRVVAIKVLTPQLASDVVARRRFQHEAQTAAAVINDHVVTIHAVDEANGLPFLVMEYIVGVSLDERIRRTGPLKVAEILRIGMQAATGLAAAHAQGLVHRDIKPSNILLENGVERVKLTDFGLARAVDDAQVTKRGVVVGTPSYMSPEQAQGEPLDHRSDLFSLGSVLYAMCTGRSPFRADSVLEAIRRVCEDTPRPIATVNPEIPGWLVALIDRLLAKKPGDRFQSATEVADLLGQYLAHVQQPSQVALPAARRKLPTSQRGSGVWPWVAAGGGLLAMTLLTVVMWQWLASSPSQGPTGGIRTAGGGPAPPTERFFFVDITKQANLLLTQPPAPGAPEGTLAELERATRNRILTVGDIPIRVEPSYIQLQGEHVPGCPQGVRGIKVDCRARKVHILHAGAWVQDSSTKPVAYYTFHYEDGSSETMPVFAGRDLRDWWSRSTLPEQATRATRAWTGTNPLVAKMKRKLQVFLCSWVNPHPQKTITSIDFERGPLPLPAPFCLGITCDQDATPLPEEKGLVIVNIAQSAELGRYSVVIGSSSGSQSRGDGQHNVLLPPGRHSVEIRDGDTVVRRASIEVAQGGIAFLMLDAQSKWLALPTPQPEPRKELTGQIGGVFGCAVSHDGQMLATAAGDGTVLLWRHEQDSWQKHATLDVHSSLVWSVAFSPAAPLLASAGNDGTLRLWDSGSALLVDTLREDEEQGTGDNSWCLDGRQRHLETPGRGLPVGRGGEEAADQVHRPLRQRDVWGVQPRWQEPGHYRPGRQDAPVGRGRAAETRSAS